MSFQAKYVGHCANGHKVIPGDYIAFTDQNLVLCTKCPDFATGGHHQEKLYSNKFCGKCQIELSIAEKDEGKKVCAVCE